MPTPRLRTWMFAVVSLHGAGCAVSATRNPFDDLDAGWFEDDAAQVDATTPLDGALSLVDGALPFDAALTLPEASVPGDASLGDGGATDAAPVTPTDSGLRDAESDTGASTPDAGFVDAGDCLEGRNGDGDELSDCDEVRDGEDWTDKDIFNGMHVRLKDQCSAAGSCSENNTRAKVTACMSGTPDQERDQYAGWDWNDSADSVCTQSYGFAPAFTQCNDTWQAEWTGTIHFASGGQHCFELNGSNDEGCAALYFDGESAPLQTGSAAHCYTRDAGDYPIMWHYTMDNGSGSSLHLRYCFGAGATCTPTEALPARLLRAASN